jgi:hypothetical protein
MDWTIAADRTLAQQRRGTMGFLMADTLLIDPMREDTVRLLDDLSEYTYAMDIVCDSDAYEDKGRPDDPGAWPYLLIRSYSD